MKPEVCAARTFVPLMAVTDKALFVPPGLFHDGQHVTVFSCDIIQKVQLCNKLFVWQISKDEKKVNVRSDTLYWPTGA